MQPKGKDKRPGLGRTGVAKSSFSGGGAGGFAAVAWVVFAGISYSSRKKRLLFQSGRDISIAGVAQVGE